MKILCDDREDGEVIERLMALGVECEVTRLKVADYVDEESKVYIERKTIEDFCLSIADGRMKKQARKMLEICGYHYILISGRIGDGNLKENCILGMISSLVFDGINVICVDTDEQLVFLMKRLFERHQETNKDRVDGGKQNDEPKNRR